MRWADMVWKEFYQGLPLAQKTLYEILSIYSLKMGRYPVQEVV